MLRTLSLSVLCSVVYTLGVLHTVGVMRAHCHCVHSDKFVAMLTLHSRADLGKNCAFRDKSMKLGTWFLDILRSILRNGATSDLTFGDL